MGLRLAEEHYVRVFYRVAAVGCDYATEDGAGGETEDEAFGLLARAGDDGGIELVVLVVEGGAKSAPGGGERILGGGQVFQCEMAVAVGDG